MKRSGWYLGVLALLILLAVHRLQRRPAVTRPEEDGAVGAAVLSFDINDVARLDVIADGATSTIARSEGLWRETSLWKYPADFDKVTRHLRRFAELKTGQVIRGGNALLAEFGLDTEAAGSERPVVLVFHDSKGAPLGRLHIGQPRQAGQTEPRAAPPEGWYVRAEDGPVILVKEFLGDVPRTARDWVNTTLLQVPAHEVRDLAVTMEDSTYRIKRNEGGLLTLEDLEEGKELVNDQADQLSRALNYVAFMNVFPRGAEEGDTGFEQPDQLRVKTAEGLIYTVLLGARPDENTRYARLVVDYEPPLPPDAREEDPSDATAQEAPPSDASSEEMQAHLAVVQRLKERTEELNTLFGGWTYVLPRYAADQMVPPRAELIAARNSPSMETP